MRLLLAQNAAYFPSYAGGSRSDRLMVDALTRRGHQCRVVARIDDAHGRRDECLAALAARGIASTWLDDGVVRFSLDAVDVHAVTRERLRMYVLGQLDTFQPDVVVVSTDPLNGLIGDLMRARATNVVYLARTTHLLPFGPDASFRSTAKTEAIRQAGVVVAVSRYLADYIRTHSGIEASHVPIQMMEPADWPALGSADNTFITIINPCALKGISLFLALADSFSDAAFAAVPTWGTTSADFEQLRARPNVRILEPADDIRDILRQTRVTLVPSLWAESRARIIVESMLCGVPVLAADVGGNREAALAVRGVLPVNPITRYTDRLDERGIRVPFTPAQDIGPWREALARLIADRDHYAAISTLSREAARQYAAGLDIGPLESLLRERARSN